MNARFPLPLFRSPRVILGRNAAAKFIAAVIAQVLGTLIAAAAR